MDKSIITGVSDDRSLTLLHDVVFERLGDREVKRSYSETDKISKTHVEYGQGNISIERDINTLSLEARTDAGEQIVKFRLRDRRFDGTPEYNTPLTEWPYNTEADKVPYPSLEISRYSRDPNLYWAEPDLREFLKEPFDFIFGDEDKFIELFNRAFVSGHFPGQSALPLRGAARFFKEKSVELSKDLGYKLTASPSHLYVAQSDEKNGFKYISTSQAFEICLIEAKLNEFGLDYALKKQQSSWITLLQKFPNLRDSELSKFWLEGLEYPLYYDDDHVENVWMVHGHVWNAQDCGNPKMPKCEARLAEFQKKYKPNMTKKE